MRAKVAAASRPAPSGMTTTSSSSSISHSKAEKRALKHNTLISRIEKSQKKPLKRRRPGKKLNTALDSLAEALPELDEESDDEWEGIDEDETMDGNDNQMQGALGELSKMVRVKKAKAADGKMKLKTLKSRPGALKRKQKMELTEKERFGKNLASMSVPTPAAATAADAGVTTNRWAALRGFIGHTLEQNPEFKKA
jgi:hypothetical protein